MTVHPMEASEFKDKVIKNGYLNELIFIQMQQIYY